MKSIRHSLFILLAMLLFAVLARAQDSVYFSNGNTVYVNSATSISGIIFDNGGPSGNYSSNFAGLVIITAHPGDTIELSGNYTTEWLNDILYVYDGYGRSGNTLGTYSGSGSLHCISVTGTMTLYFSSNTIFNRSGFSLTYNIHSCLCSNFIYNFSYNSLTAVSVNLTWQAVDIQGPSIPIPSRSFLSRPIQITFSILPLLPTLRSPIVPSPFLSILLVFRHSYEVPTLFATEIP